MKTRTITLSGTPCEELRVPADILVDAVASLLDGARQATRFFVEGQSTRKGTRPGWLDDVCNLEITRMYPGSVAIAVEAPTLADAAPDRFGRGLQVALFAEPQRTIDPDSTAIDLFATVLESALKGDRDHVLADRGLLDTCVRFARSARGRFGHIELTGTHGRSAPLVVRSEDVPMLELLRDETPSPKAVRVAGTLDTISATKPSIVLVLADGTKVSARLEEQDNDGLKGLFGTRVVVSGVAQFRPSGKLLAIDVEHLGPARPGDVVFEVTPRAVPKVLPVPSTPADSSSGVSAFFGTWPGDETDEELLAALEAIR
jgi:hypothetical protein